MAVSQEFMDFVVGQLSGFGEVTIRRMFGGAGLYLSGVFFGVIDDDRLYFKVDDATRNDYIEAGMSPFKPYGEEGYAMSYYEVPESALENPEQLSAWALKAADVARRSRRKKRQGPHR
jgi:DNA transformation protein